MSDGLPKSLLADLQAVVGHDAVVTDPERLQPRLTEWRGLFTGRAVAMLMPASTDQAAAAMKLCYEHGVGMVPQGGNTSLVGGSIPHSAQGRPEVILATDRLNRIRELDADNFTITAEAGCVLADLQAAAAAAQRLFPLSLGAEGSCRIGGNVSTNAGGINVLRYGNTRSLVLGLEAVLPDGRVFDGLRALRKDNTGYDLKQLFIGAEGTLGLVTAVCCRLFPQPGSRATAMVGVKHPQAAIELLSVARASLGDGLEAFELINRHALELVVEHIPGSRDPLESPQPCYVLLEVAVPGDDATEQLERFLTASLERGQVLDGVLAQNQALAQLLWHMRHSISEAQKHAGAGIKHDV
ncbi:MAG TPA: FAD-binding oxidoreductase, partial [Chromatiales bacterium]|nr:FAD-binding oxidoreductase [Chromatiales bacterium]